MDFDLAQVRAFVLLAEESHFGRAADELLVTQQALSKRIRRLEDLLDEKLFLRDRRRVELTETGRRFLPHARHLLAAAEAASTAAWGQPRSLRIDVWRSCFGPLRELAPLFRQIPELELDTSTRGDLHLAVGALGRHEIDAAFGRVDQLANRWPEILTHRPVLLEGIAVAVSEHHPLAAAKELHPSDLRRWGLWWPVGTGPREMVDYAHRFAEAFGVAVDIRRYGVGLVSPIELLLEDPARVVAWGAGWPIAESGALSIPLVPTPLYPWSMVWRKPDEHPSLSLLQKLVAEAAHSEAWLAFDPEHHWLPDGDMTALQRAADTPWPPSHARGMT